MSTVERKHLERVIKQHETMAAKLRERIQIKRDRIDSINVQIEGEESTLEYYLIEIKSKQDRLKVIDL